MAVDDPEFELAKADFPIYSRARFLPPTRVSGANIKQSLISHGCRIHKDAVIENSVIGLRTIIGPNVVIKDSIVMGCDFYESEEDSTEGRTVPVGIGEGSVIEGAIIDKDVSIGRNARIVNESKREETSLEHPTCVIRDGIPIVMKNSEIKDGWNLEDEV
jgi:glucose-1-phosphate adenylyltransferase